MSRLSKTAPILNVTAIALIGLSLLMVFFYAPVEQNMGNVYRLIYFHVGTAWVASLTFLIALIGGIAYLRTGKRSWDTLSLASIEVGIIFITMTTAAGSIWGKPAWDTWWTWSPRLILMVVMWLVYIAYFILRSAVEDEQRRFRFAAIYAIAAFVTVIMCYGSIRVLRDIHPVVFGSALETAEGASQGEAQFFDGDAERASGLTLAMSSLAFTVLYAAWVVNRFRLRDLQDKATQLKLRLAARMSV